MRIKISGFSKLLPSTFLAIPFCRLNTPIACNCASSLGVFFCFFSNTDFDRKQIPLHLAKSHSSAFQGSSGRNLKLLDVFRYIYVLYVTSFAPNCNTMQKTVLVVQVRWLEVVKIVAKLWNKHVVPVYSFTDNNFSLILLHSSAAE